MKTRFVMVRAFSFGSSNIVTRFLSPGEPGGCFRASHARLATAGLHSFQRELKVPRQKRLLSSHSTSIRRGNSAVFLDERKLSAGRSLTSKSRGTTLSLMPPPEQPSGVFCSIGAGGGGELP